MNDALQISLPFAVLANARSWRESRWPGFARRVLSRPKPGIAARLLGLAVTVGWVDYVTRSLKLNLQAVAGDAVLTENDAARALAAARDCHPHLMLLDVLMPHLDSRDVSAQIHADAGLKETPIVFLTALAHNEDTGGHAVAAGATIHLAKPVDAEERIKGIAQTLSPTLQPQCHAHAPHL